MTLQQLFEKQYTMKLIAKGSKERTVWEIQNSLNRWNALFGDTPVEAVTDLEMNHFITVLRGTTNHRGESISPNTIRKHLRNIKSLLLFARSKGLISALPEISMPKERMRNARDMFTYEEIRKLLAAADVFSGDTVNGMDAVTWWRSLITFLYGTALRISTATSVQFDWIADGLLEIREGEGIKTQYIVPLSYEAEVAVGSMQESHKETCIFPWPYHRRHLHRCFKRLVVAAGIPPERQFGFHAIRKHTVTEIGRINPAAASKLAGHTSQDVTNRYYINGIRSCEDVVNELRPLTERDGLWKRIMRFIRRKK